MPFVLDASVVACWAFQDEDHSTADSAFLRMRTDEAVVPCVWWFEVRNMLVMNERRNRIKEADTAGFLRAISRLPIRIDRLPEETTVLYLARIYKLSVYDASYLEVAKREAIPLATLDAKLANAARSERISLIG